MNLRASFLTASNIFRKWAIDERGRAQAIRFIIAGLKNNALYYILYVFLTVSGVPPTGAVVAVFIFGLLYAFLFSKAFVFRDRREGRRQFARYLFVYLLLLLSNIALMNVAVKLFHINHLVAQPAIAAVLTAPLFLLLKFFVFSSRNGV